MDENTQSVEEQLPTETPSEEEILNAIEGDSDELDEGDEDIESADAIESPETVA